MTATLKTLTPRQQDIYNFIRKYQRDYHMSPSLGDISKECNCTRSRAQHFVNRLVDLGYFMKTHKGTIELLSSPPGTDAHPSA